MPPLDGRMGRSEMWRLLQCPLCMRVRSCSRSLRPPDLAALRRVLLAQCRRPGAVSETSWRIQGICTVPHHHPQRRWVSLRGQLNRALTFASFQASRTMQGATCTISSRREGREIYSRKWLRSEEIATEILAPAV